MTDAAADGDVIEESNGWRIGHIQDQQYDFFTLLTYLATDVKMRGSGITDAQTGDDEQWRFKFRRSRAIGGTRDASPVDTAACRCATAPQGSDFLDRSRPPTHSGWYDIPHPVRTDPRLRSPLR